MNRYMGWLACGAMTLLPAVTVVGEPSSITIRGDTHQVWPIQLLQERGFDVRVIPEDQNAAGKYLEAVNAYADLPDSLEDAFGHVLAHAWLTDQKALADFMKQDGNQRAISLARRASHMEQCQMPYFGDPEGSIISMLLPNLSHLRMLSKTMVVEAKRLEAQGKIDDAIEIYLDVMRMGGHISQGVTLIEGLVGVAVWNLANDNLTRLVLRQPLTEKQLVALDKRLADPVTHAATIERGLANERRFGPSIVDEMCTRPLRSLGALFGGSSGVGGEEWLFHGGNPNPSDGWGRLELRIGRLMFPDRAIKSHMDGFYRHVAAMSKVSAVEWDEAGVSESEYLDQAVPKWDIVTRVLMPSFERSIDIGHRMTALHVMARTVVALKHHALRHDGAWPASLDEVVGFLPESALLDPFGRGRIKYKKSADGWLLYSVGADLVDDGGQQGESWFKLDIVIGYPLAPVPPLEGR